MIPGWDTVGPDGIGPDGIDPDGIGPDGIKPGVCDEGFGGCEGINPGG